MKTRSLFAVAAVLIYVVIIVITFVLGRNESAACAAKGGQLIHGTCVSKSVIIP